MAIAAISTAMAPGGLGVLRISGEDAAEIGDRVFRGISGKRLCEYKGYRAGFGEVRDSENIKIDDAVALVFRAPKSFTGEDTVELSCHGGIYVMNAMLDAVLKAGARAAEPGEFTKRAFINGKMDLTQAESVMQLIRAGGEQAAREAAAAADGRLSRRIGELKEMLKSMTAHLAAWADFPEEDVPEVDEGNLKSQLDDIKKELEKLLASFDKGQAFREGIDAVIAGKTNAGKSTLMNLISGKERSIVTHIPGTTRDVVEDTVILAGVTLRLADTAGIRNTADPVEKIGVDRSWQRLGNARLVLAVFDASTELDDNDRRLLEKLNPKNTIGIINKTDLPVKIEMKEIGAVLDKPIQISAGTGEGIEAIEKKVTEILDIGGFDPSAGTLYTKRQQEDAKEAYDQIESALDALASGMTLDAVTISIEEAFSALCRLSGENVSEEIVDRVFGMFCVGK